MSDDNELKRGLRMMQIITVAQVAGAVALAITFLILRADEPIPDRPMVLTWVALGMVALMAVLSIVIPPMVAPNAIRRIASGAWQPPLEAPPENYSSDNAKLLTVRQTELLIATALLEGAAFFGCIAYFLEVRLFALVAAAVAIVLILIRFPTEARVREWLEEHSRRLEELRQVEGFRNGM